MSAVTIVSFKYLGLLVTRKILAELNLTGQRTMSELRVSLELKEDQRAPHT